MDKGIVLEASQDPYGAMYYTVYNEDFSELYYRSERFAYPEKRRHILCCDRYRVGG